MTNVIPCVLSRQTATVFLYLEWIPVTISAAISGINMVLAGNIFFYAVSVWLFLSHYQLYPFQAYFNMIRPEILCALGEETYKFPSIVMYYVGSVGTIVIVYALLWPTRTSYIRWVWVFLLFMVPAFTLVWFQFNVWYEVLFTFLWSIVMNMGFMLLARFFLAPAWAYLECVPPYTWMGVNDTGGWLCEHTPEYLAMRRHLHKHAGISKDLGKASFGNDSAISTPNSQTRWWHILT